MLFMGGASVLIGSIAYLFLHNKLIGPDKEQRDIQNRDSVLALRARVQEEEADREDSQVVEQE